MLKCYFVDYDLDTRDMIVNLEDVSELVASRRQFPADYRVRTKCQDRLT